MGGGSVFAGDLPFKTVLASMCPLFNLVDKLGGDFY